MHTNQFVVIIISDVDIINCWSPGGSFMIQKMAITSPIPVFQGIMTFRMNASQLVIIIVMMKVISVMKINEP